MRDPTETQTGRPATPERDEVADDMNEEGREDDAGGDCDDLDVEIALLAATAGRDTGAPTATVNLDALSPAEKRTLIAVLRRNLGVGPLSPEREAGGGG